jgi:hypothetical protein
MVRFLRAAVLPEGPIVVRAGAMAQYKSKATGAPR